MWRVLTDASGAVTEPLSAAAIAERLWAAAEPTLWAEPAAGGDGAFPQEIPEVRAILLTDPMRVAGSWLSRSPSWVHEWVMELAEACPDDVLPIIWALVEVAARDKDLAFVAAGPLEEVLNHQGPAVIARVEAEAAANPRLRLALSGVWRSRIRQDVWDRIRVLVGSEPGLDG